MQRLLIVNADDFGLSKGINYGIIEAVRNGVVRSTTAMMNAPAIDHAASLSAETPQLGVGLHFVLSYGAALTDMPSLTREGRLGKWIWEVAEQGQLNLGEIEQELSSQYQRFIDVFKREPTHLDSHHSVHMIPQVYPIVARFAREKNLPLRIDRSVLREKNIDSRNVKSSDGFSSDFYDENISEDFFLSLIDRAIKTNDKSLEIMCHPGFIDTPLMLSSYCYQRLEELAVLTTSSLKYEIEKRGFHLVSFRNL
ncbi:chitin disaccharide deacetylase [Escherichia coli]|uniref:chitin disaccharide deacetylase n=1 Tax=Escherichia coli TaxID=562 RepID=UPI00148EC01C|nr:chitin disaccharide deacetylase [Escherichia coli]QJU26865.1 chitin disaccharide deacetylase [Escherichia coli]